MCLLTILWRALMRPIRRMCIHGYTAVVVGA